MFTLRKPDRRRLEQVRDAYRHRPFTYPEVGRSRGTPPRGYTVDHHRVRLGAGAADFERGRQAVREWRLFRLGWLEPCWPDAPVQQGALVGTLAWLNGLWTVNVCRIVYVIEETGPVSRFGFAYGTLPGHVERGEERFTVEWHAHDDSVWYDVLAFSTPGRLVTWLGYPLARRLQKRCARDSMRAVATAVHPIRLHASRNLFSPGTGSARWT
jgi:uncharacterized protein (UPF0548 family)